MNYEIRSSSSYGFNEQEYDYFIRKSPNFIQNEIVEHLTNIQSSILLICHYYNRLDLLQTGLQFDITDLSEEDVSLEIVIGPENGAIIQILTIVIHSIAQFLPEYWRTRAWPVI